MPFQVAVSIDEAIFQVSTHYFYSQSSSNSAEGGQTFTFSGGDPPTGGDSASASGSASISEEAGFCVSNITTAATESGATQKTTQSFAGGLTCNGEGSTAWDNIHYNNTTSATSEIVPFVTTSTYEETLELPIDDGSGFNISTTYSKMDLSFTSFPRTYTTLTSQNSIAVGAGGITANKLRGQSVLIFGGIGTDWTFDGNAIPYLQVLSSTGSSPVFLYPSISKEDVGVVFPLAKSTSQANTNLLFDMSGGTLFEESKTTLTFNIFTLNTQTYTQSSGFSFDPYEERMISFEQSTSLYSFLETATTTEETIYQQLVSFEPQYSEGLYSALKIGLMTSTKVDNAKTTSEGSIFSFFGTYSKSYSYSQTVWTTTNVSYVVADFGVIGTGSVLNTFSNFASGSGSDPFVTYFSSSSSTSQQAAGLTINPEYVELSIAYYALNMVNTAKPTFFTQKLPDTNFFVFSSKMDSGIFKNVSPTSALEYVYVKTYALHRYAPLGRIPPLAVPIDTTKLLADTNGDQTATAVQKVMIPSRFYFGEESASVSITTNVEVNSTSTETSSSTYAVGYAGSGDFFTFSQAPDSVYDFTRFVDRLQATNIYHTLGVAGKSLSKNAEWSLDGFLYWTGSSEPERVTVGTYSNPVRAIGNRNILTFVATSYANNNIAGQNAFISGLKFYQNQIPYI
jgi:hypothetical protein